VAKAGFGARFASLLIDGVVLALLYVPGFLVLYGGPTETEPCSVDSSGNIVLDGTNNAICEVPTAGAWAAAFGLWVAALCVSLAYVAILEGKRTQTLGQQALGIRTVDQYSGQPVGPGRAIARYFARILSAIPCFLGYFWMLWDENKQTWHDKMVGSVVVVGRAD
jgi:uncharacterized RDD family membrane protein YckC